MLRSPVQHAAWPKTVRAADCLASSSVLQGSRARLRRRLNFGQHRTGLHYEEVNLCHEHEWHWGRAVYSPFSYDTLDFLICWSAGSEASNYANLLSQLAQLSGATTLSAEPRQSTAQAKRAAETELHQPASRKAHRRIARRTEGDVFRERLGGGTRLE